MDQGTKGRPDWAVIREEYEARLFPPAVICRRHGISPAQLRYRREAEGWVSVRSHVPKRTDLVAQMLKVLAQQIRILEAAVNEPIEKQASVLAIEVKTLDKLIELGAAKPDVEPATRKDMTDLRAKLVRRMEQFKAR